MSFPRDSTPPKPSNLLRMRFDSSDDKAELAQRLLDPVYIRGVLRDSMQKQQLDLGIQHALQSGQGRRPLVPRPELHARSRETPVRPGEASDFLSALMGVPAISKAIDSIKASAVDKLKGDWRRLSAGGKAAVITQTVIMGAGSVAGILASQSGRKGLYELLKDNETPIPVPGVPGMELRLKTGNEQRAVVMFDIAKFLRSR